MALYSIWSKPFIRRSGPIPFTTLGMEVGTAVLVVLSKLRGSLAPVESFGPPQRLAVLYLGAFGSALTFYLWSFALERTTPTRVVITVTVNPPVASLVGATLLGEPLRWNLLAGSVTVFIGIWIATAQSRRKIRSLAKRRLFRKPRRLDVCEPLYSPQALRKPPPRRSRSRG
jgi:drug/metabolite transporter (DMT)-like permease